MYIHYWTVYIHYFLHTHYFYEDTDTKKFCFPGINWKITHFHLYIYKLQRHHNSKFCSDAPQITVLFLTPSFTTDFFFWKTKGLKATGFWNAFSTCAVYGGIQKQPTIYIAGKLWRLRARGIFLICLSTGFFLVATWLLLYACVSLS